MSETTQQPESGTAADMPRVLIVEDEFLIRLTLAEVLTDEGFEVLEAETGDAAALIMDGRTDIAVLLTDMQLPGKLDGRALVQHARRAVPMLPVVFMTGRPDALAPDGSGAPEIYVAKPYLPSEICAAVRRLLA